MQLRVKCVITILFIPVFLFAQQETDGDWPEPAYQKFPSQHDFTAVVDIARGDYGWFDNYLHAVMVDHNDRIWLAGRYGLAYSDDNGLKWHRSYSMNSVCDVFETRNHTLLASSDNSYTLRSVNNGIKWTRLRVFGRGGPSGRSSHGERYTDVFYVQLNDKRILRTCQYSNKLLLSDDEGRTWRIVNGPDHPVSIHNIGDTLAVMFTYDEMYTSKDGGETWTKQREGLPLPKNPEYEVINTGTVLDDGTVMALVTVQEEDVYEHYAWFYNTRNNKWSADTSRRKYSWGQSMLHAVGNNRLLLYDHVTNSYSMSFDKGNSWGNITGKEYMSYIQDIHVSNDKIYFVSSSTLSCINLPAICSENSGELPLSDEPYISLPDSSRGKIAIAPLKAESECESFCMYQKCAVRGPGYTSLIMHVEEPDTLNVINILHWEGDVMIIEETLEIYAALQPGDYAVHIYNNVGWSGAYYLQCRFVSDRPEDVNGTVCYFY